MSVPIYTVNWPELELDNALSLLAGATESPTNKQITWQRQSHKTQLVPWDRSKKFAEFTAVSPTLIQSFEYTTDGYKDEDYFIIMRNSNLIQASNYIKEAAELYVFNRSWVLNPNDTLSFYYINNSHTSRTVSFSLVYGVI